MNHSLFRSCCTAITLAAIMLGTCFIPMQRVAQAQETDGPELFVTAGSTVFALATAPGLGAQPQRLISFEANTPGTLRSDVVIQGLQVGETLKGIDFRPATGELYGLGSTSRLYRINFTTGVATPVGTGTFAPAVSPVDFFGVDFNPVPDRFRVVSAVTNQNFRLNPDSGAVVDFDANTAGTQPDTNVAYASGDPNAGDEPNVVGAAYTNNFAGATATTLYGIDARASGGFARLVTIGGVNGTPTPNGGQLNTVGNLRSPAGADLETNNLVGFDITSGGTAYVSLTPINPFDAPSSLYTVDLATRTTTLVGVIGRDSTATGGLKIEGIAVVTNVANQTTSTFQITATTATIAENATPGSVTVTVTRTGTTTAAGSVDYTTVDGTASERMDYITSAGRLFFAAGETSKTVTILIQDDAFQEGTETFSFVITNPNGGTVPTAGRSQTITITDNDTTTATTNPIDNRDFFVRQQYRDFLNRDPDAPGFAFWTGEYDRRVNACSTITNANDRVRCVATARASISLSFFLSVEFQQTGYLVYRTYDVAFGRIGTPRPARGQNVAAVAVTYNEFIRDTQTIARDIIANNAIDQTRLEANRQAYFRDFVQRADFIDRFPENQSASQYVDALFASANITPTAAERQAAITAFGGGGTDGRAAALREIAQNNDQEFQREFNRAFVLLQYVGYLRRDPDIAGYNFWLNKLDAASTATRIDPANVPNDAEAIGRVRRAEIIESFTRSCEYQRRFGVPTTSPNDTPVGTACSNL